LALFPAPMLPHPCHFNPLCSCSFHPTKVGFRNLIKILFEVLIWNIGIVCIFRSFLYRG
jgi:hypothetical protein